MSREIEGRMGTGAEQPGGEGDWLPTGNEYVSLPTIRGADAAIERLGVLHRGLGCQLEVCGAAAAAKAPAGEALLVPTMSVDGEERRLPGALRWQRLGHFVPRFTWGAPGQGVHLEGAIVAPRGEKGFAYVLRAHNPAAAAGPARVCLGLKGQWGDTLQSVLSAGRVFATHRVRRDPGSGGPVFEVRPGAALLGWAMVPGAPLDVCDWRPAGAATAGGADPRELAVAAGEPLLYEFSKCFEIAPGGWAELAFYFGLNREGDGAVACGLDLARRGWRRLLDGTLDWLERRTLSLPRLEEGERARLEEVANRNLFFNYFFALGRCIDTEELALVTSRSPRYPASGVFRARDALLWSLPAVLLVDPAAAREVLEAAFSRYLRHAGTHALYLDGRALAPGFELDGLCAYVVGLGHYVEHSGDTTLLREPGVSAGLKRVESLMFARKNVGEWLFSTELEPSAEPAARPYLTFGNALVVRSLEILQSWSARGLHDVPRPPATAADVRAYGEMAAKVREAIGRHLVVPGPFGPMYAWASEVECQKSEANLFDAPEGSLLLLAHHGLCSADDEVFRNTVRWVHSEHNPRAGRFPDVGSPHTGHPSVLGLANSLLAGRVEEAKAVLLEAPLDSGLACEGFDPDAGTPTAGPGFAACAGFLAYALARAFS